MHGREQVMPYGDLGNAERVGFGRAFTFSQVLWFLLIACGSAEVERPDSAKHPAHVALTTAPTASAGRAFHDVWSQGTAELSSYQVVLPRYDELRSGQLVLTYVTEPLDRCTRIKDDDAPADQRLTVLKLNANLSFQTGIYPYSVMTTVLAPIDAYRPALPRFSPIKITLSVQEWCGHVFHGVWPGDSAFEEQIISYFASEGEARRLVAAPLSTLYEDALLIQLRELDGPFAFGGDWQGRLVPSLWRLRRAHRAATPLVASITREATTRDGTEINRFVLVAGEYTRTFEVERRGAQRILAWETSEGERATLRNTARLAYWQLNHVGDESQRRALGLPVDPYGTFPGSTRAEPKVP